MYQLLKERYRDIPTPTLAGLASGGSFRQRALYPSLNRDQLLRVMATEAEDRDMARHRSKLPYKLRRMSIKRAIEDAFEGTTAYICHSCGKTGPYLFFNLPFECLGCAVARKRKPSDLEFRRREERKNNPLPKDHLGKVLEGQGFRCYVCNMPIAKYPGCGWKKATLDHDVAMALGGTNDEENAKHALCQPCNSSKNRSDMRGFINRWRNLEKQVEEAGGRCPECQRLYG